MKTNNWAMLCLSPSKGGLEMVAVDTIKNINKFRYAIVLEKTWIADSLSHLASKNIYPTLKPTMRFFPYITALKIARWIVNHNITILHIHWAKDLPLASLIKRILTHKQYKLILIVSRHMELPHSKKGLYHRWLFTPVNGYISVCNFVHNQAKHNLPLPVNKLYKVYPGVDALQKAHNLPFTIDSNKINIITLGRLEPAKGQHLMLQALASHTKSNVHCYFIGHTMNKSYLSELNILAENLGVLPYVTFCGFISEPAQYLPYFDALVLTTRCETFGLVLIEAMRAGILAIGSQAGGVTEIIKHQKTGLLFETENSMSLAKQLTWFISHPSEVTTIALEGKKRAEQLFDKKTNYHLLEGTINNFK